MLQDSIQENSLIAVFSLLITVVDMEKNIRGRCSMIVDNLFIIFFFFFGMEKLNKYEKYKKYLQLYVRTNELRCDVWNNQDSLSLKRRVYINDVDKEEVKIQREISFRRIKTMIKLSIVHSFSFTICISFFTVVLISTCRIIFNSPLLRCQRLKGLKEGGGGGGGR